MERAWLIPVVVGAITAASIVATRSPVTGDAPAVGDGVDTGNERLVDLDAYIDPDFGFSLAVPAGWTAVIAADDGTDLARLEPGYAVGFESPREHAGDVFADYLVVEIMPGDDTGLFETDGRRRRETRVNGRTAWRDALSLPADPSDPDAVDLVVRQAAVSGLGYTVGLYAIGEPERLPFLEDAFEAMLRTFRLTRAPFEVS